MVEYRLTTSATWSTFAHAPTSASAINVNGLTNGASYEFRVRAVNAAGNSPLSNVAGPLVPMTTASVPLNLVGTFGDSKVTLAWATPASNGGGPISDYRIQYREARAGAPWTTVPHAASTATSIIVTGLANGTPYIFRVAAVNPVGFGATEETSRITPMTIPGAPAIVSATAGNASVALAWRAPGSNGGGAISNYIIEYKVDGPSVTWTRFPRVASSATTATVTGLANGTSYLLRVTAVNAAGIGPASNTSDPVMPVTVPTVAYGVVAVGGDKQARLTWNAPASNGGLAVIDYVVEVRAAGAATWTTFADGVSAATSATVTGLTNGVTYTFRVTAKNSFGSSAASAESVPVVVLGLPGVPSAPVATAGVRAEVHLAWTAPTETGGVALTDYRIEYRRNTDTVWTSHPHTASPAAGIVINGLSTGSTYVFRVSAVNSLGAGLASAISNAVTVIAAPTQPTNVVARAGDKVVNLSWIAPATSNGSAITDYVIEMRKSTDATWTVYADSVSAATSAVVANLANGTTYAFRIYAKNGAGLSAPSAESVLVRPVGPAAGRGVERDGDPELGCPHRYRRKPDHELRCPVPGQPGRERVGDGQVASWGLSDGDDGEDQWLRDPVWSSVPRGGGDVDGPRGLVGGVRSDQSLRGLILPGATLLPGGESDLGMNPRPIPQGRFVSFPPSSPASDQAAGCPGGMG